MQARMHPEDAPPHSKLLQPAGWQLLLQLESGPKPPDIPRTRVERDVVPGGHHGAVLLLLEEDAELQAVGGALQGAAFDRACGPGCLVTAQAGMSLVAAA